MGRLGRIARRVLAYALAFYVGAPITAALIFAVVPPPATPLMVARLLEGEGWSRDWVPLEAISPSLVAAVIAAEDNLFCAHRGFDWESMEDALSDIERGRRVRGASTISMQTAKNLFLWPDSSVLRKLLEPYPTLVLELLWSKRRIIEVYLNVAEWAPGVYGAAAAARHHFGKEPADLSRREAALLAVVLPNPLKFSAGKPSDYVRQRASVIMRRMSQLDGLLGCVIPS
ncbi:MAG: monofunctional biosynthetic peptidoglycan transglycosylase [Alphaproteobacteria bacterium]